MQPDPSFKSIQLHGSLTVERASALKQEIAEVLAAGKNILLDFAQVEDLDLACLQLLYATAQLASKEGKELRFRGSLPSRVSERLLACGILRVDSERAEDFESALLSL
jgi:anti-anti-sigma regulatory factor